MEKLHKVPRTGYVDRGVKDPETVGEHTDEMILIAEELFHIPGLTTMLKIHDWAESNKKIGDRRTDSLCPPDKRWTKEKKYKAELRAMKNICSRLGPYGPRILRLWLEFEEKRTWRAKIANQIDKFQMIRKAIRYQIAGQPVIAQEFIDHDGPKITNYLLSFELTKARLKL
ncbi:MAG: HD domain-containing protein [Patescibacteria group bacterium]